MNEFIAAGFWRSILVLFIVLMISVGIFSAKSNSIKNSKKKEFFLMLILFLPSILTLTYIWIIRDSIGWLIAAIVTLLGFFSVLGDVLSDDKPTTNKNTASKATDSETNHSESLKEEKTQNEPNNNADEKSSSSNEINITYTFPSYFDGQKQTVIFKQGPFKIWSNSISELMGEIDISARMDSGNKYEGIFDKAVYEEYVNELGAQDRFYWGYVYYNQKNIVVHGLDKNKNGRISILGDNAEDNQFLAKIIFAMFDRYYFENVQYTDSPEKFYKWDEINEAFHFCKERTDNFLDNSENHKIIDKKSHNLMKILKLLPHTNCGECKYEDCFEFARKVVSKNITIDNCPYAEKKTGTKKKKSKNNDFIDKEENSDDLLELCRFFSIEYENLNEADLKKSYRKMMIQYHPDKVETLADDFKELAIKKSKEINEKYEILSALIKQKEE